MTDAPERIRLHKEKGKPWTSAQWDDDFYNPLEDVEIFIRADIAEQRIREAEAAAYRRAADECLKQLGYAKEEWMRGNNSATRACHHAILNLTPEEPK